ncbi:MAG: AAA-like domain-containing protein, partial [Halothece sp.]
MTIDELIDLLNSSQSERITPLQEWILRQSWKGKTYANMSCQGHYTAEHIRKIGAELWSLLSQVLEMPITKSNIRQKLEDYTLTPTQRELIKAIKFPSSFSSLSFPSSPLSANSHYYISRPPVEQLAYAEIQKPGSLIRIKAPSKFGKTSLILHLLDYANKLGYDTVSLDFLLADKAIFKDLNKFLRWFSINISRTLQLESKLNSYWNEDMGSKVSCCLYFQKYILNQSDRPLVLTLNEVNRVFEYPEITEDFFSLL